MNDDEIISEIFFRYIEKIGKDLVYDITKFDDLFLEIKRYISNEEKIKSEKILNLKNKKLFIIRKVVTRIVLSRFLKIKPCEVEYYHNDFGKPYVKDRKIFFNISHSKEYLFIGISNRREIGVDIEKINNKLNYEFLIDDVFSKKESLIYKKYDEKYKKELLFKCWVQKEAILKALGVGITVDMKRIETKIINNSNEYTHILEYGRENKLIKISVNSNDKYFMSKAIIL
jgi:4'-phosphopantetheinyl transferase